MFDRASKIGYQIAPLPLRFATLDDRGGRVHLHQGSNVRTCLGVTGALNLLRASSFLQAEILFHRPGSLQDHFLGPYHHQLPGNCDCRPDVLLGLPGCISPPLEEPIRYRS